MRRAIPLTLALSSLGSASFFGDWRVWAPSHEAKMGVVSGKTAWVATGGGVLEWNLDAPSAEASRLHSRRDGLPTLDITSIVLDSQKTLWAIGSDGHMAYRELGAASWQIAESYANQGWTFLPRAAMVWKGILLLGSDKGLSLYSLANKSAEDNVRSFGSKTGSVTSVMVTPAATGPRDTLWVSLSSGVSMFATPDWDSIGRPGHFLADPSKWTVREDWNMTSTSNDFTLVRDSNGVRLWISPLAWTDLSRKIRIAKDPASRLDTVIWNDNRQVVRGALHASSIHDGNLLVSTSGSGAMIVAGNGDIAQPNPERIPGTPPLNVQRQSDGTWIARHFNVVYTYDGKGSWSVDTAYLERDGKREPATWDAGEDERNHRQALAIGPDGERYVASWGHPNSRGGYYVGKSGNWSHFASTDADSCISYTIDPTSIARWTTDSSKLFGSAVRTIRSFANGTWAGAGHYSKLGRILFIAPGGTAQPTCFDLPKDNVGSAGNVLVNDILQLGDTLWFATNFGIGRVVGPRPGKVPLEATTTYFKKSDRSDLPIWRLKPIEIKGARWLLGSAQNRLVLFPASGSWRAGSTTSTSLITSDTLAPSLDQEYVAIAVDGQNQIWAAGDKGIDIVGITEPDADLPVGLNHIRRITTLDGLPDNMVYDISLDSSTGMAMVATRSAIALWTSPYRPMPPKLAKSKVRVWPNPIRLRNLGENRTFFVDGATADSRFDLLAADGTLVMHLDASQQMGGMFTVKLPDSDHLGKLRPGLYFWSLKDKSNSVRGPLLIAE